MKESKPIKVMIVDDHDIYRDGLRLIFNRQSKITLVAEAKNGSQAIEMTKTFQPDVILMDILMPVLDGISATRHLQKHFPTAHVIALSMQNEDNLIIDMLEAGAKGFLLKNADKKDIIEAIQSVYLHTPYYCPSTTTKLAQQIARSKYNPNTRSRRRPFTEKEINVMHMICEELTSRQIAKRLYISRRTVEGHRQRILEKLKTKTAIGIVIYCIKEGLFRPK